MSPAAASSSGPSRASIDKADQQQQQQQPPPRPGTRMSARERAKTETGLGLALRGSAVGSPITPNEGSGGGAGLWAGGEGVVRREMSVATKLNIPPPLRPMQPRQSGTISPHVAAGTGSGSAASGPLASGVYPGSGGALASLGNGAGSGSGSQHSFTEQVGRLPGARHGVSCRP